MAATLYLAIPLQVLAADIPAERCPAAAQQHQVRVQVEIIDVVQAGR
jgi:hypothetical protein